MRKMKKVALKRNDKEASLFQTKDIDGNIVLDGDTVALLDDQGIEMVDIDTLEDVTGVVSSLEGNKVIIDGMKYPEGSIRRIMTKK